MYIFYDNIVVINYFFFFCLIILVGCDDRARCYYTMMIIITIIYYGRAAKPSLTPNAGVDELRVSGGNSCVCYFRTSLDSDVPIRFPEVKG